MDATAGLKRPDIQSINKIVVKIGSSLVTDDGRGINRPRLLEWSRQIAYLTDLGKSVVLVTSGAIAEGLLRLGWSVRPKMLRELQAAAAIGQMGLIRAYEESFAQYNRKTAQILITHDDLSDRTRYLNAQSTIKTLIDCGIVPIINENDTVVTEEITLGDNDTLGALIANLIDADLLVILTDQAGLFTADPRKDPTATRIELASASDHRLEALAGGAGTQYGRGGMATKITAARRAAQSGTHTIIASGREPDVLMRLYQNEPLGTCLIADHPKRAARKNWIANQLQMSGRLILDDGAVAALRHSGRSLLPIGVIGVEGDFKRGAMVACTTESGADIAHGLVNYPANDTRKIIRRASSEIESILGYVNEPELIHRDNLILTTS